jgi:hypothetical protein
VKKWGGWKKMRVERREKTEGERIPQKWLSRVKEGN